MKVLKIAVNKKPEIIDIDGSLDILQKVVGGYIEVIYPFEDEVGLVCNEEGKINGECKPNRALVRDGKIIDVIYGDFMLVGLTIDDFTDFPTELVERYSNMFDRPVWYGNAQVCVID